MRRARVVVGGQVQGVFFRATCRRIATDLGVSGWVRNLPSGKVEASFEGDPAAVEAAVSWCRRGPSGALIATVEVIDEPPTGAVGFRIIG